MRLDINKLKQGHLRTLSKSITLIESQRQQDITCARELLSHYDPSSYPSIRIAISGPPGVGKSTFIEALGMELSERGKKIAVLAIDPSSPISGGSLLGDKTRMENLARQENVFIRPTPSTGTLGGVGQRTLDTINLCELAGFEIIIIETVGVGQSELDALNLSDYFVVLSQPGSGDDLQGVKKGIVEVADALIINKADGDLLEAANRAKNDLLSAAQLSGRHEKVLVESISSLNRDDIKKLWQQIQSKIQSAKKSGEFQLRRDTQKQFWIQNYLKLEFALFIQQDIEFNTSFQEKIKQFEFNDNFTHPRWIAHNLFKDLIPGRPKS